MAQPDPVKEALAVRPLWTKQGTLDRLFALWFNGFVYNQVWEDPRVDLEALRLTPESRVLMISSGGCNVLNYLKEGPESIAAVDVNRYHIYLTRLKLAAYDLLPGYEDVFSFFGEADSSRNVDNYFRYIRRHLDSEARRFWEEGSWLRRRFLSRRIDYFANNFYDYSKLGFLLRLIGCLAGRLHKDPGKLLQMGTLEEQQRLFDELYSGFFDSRVVRLIGRLPLVLFSLGIPPRQLEAMKREGVTDVMALYRERARRLLCEFPVSENYFLWQAMTRRYDIKNRKAVPDYLKGEHYPAIRRHIRRVSTHIEPIRGFLQKQPDRSLNRFVLLDAQDWMEADEITALWQELARVGQPGSRIVFRTGGAKSVVEGSLLDSLEQQFVYEKKLSQRLHQRDRSAIYGGFHIYSLRA